MTDDRRIERQRYEAYAKDLLAESTNVSERAVDSPQSHLAAPFKYFASEAASLIRPESRVLELGAGTGAVSQTLSELTSQLVALDISSTALLVSRRADPRIFGVCGDMAQLPFPAESFDVVASAGALSYAEPAAVDEELRRVLKPGGALLVIDSMNHSPIYRLNRWVNYRRGRRTLSTLKRMPDRARVAALASNFDRCHIRYFGSADFLFPVLSKVVGPETASRQVMALNIDRAVTAFKFVLVARGFRRRPIRQPSADLK